MRLVGLFFLMISIGPTVEVVQHFLGISVGQNYTEIYKYATPLGWNAAPAILSRFINPGILMLLVGCKNHKKLAIIVAVFMVLYASLWLFIGSRAPAAMLLVAFIWCWDSYVKPLPKSLLLIGGSVLVFVFFPILSIIRFNSAVYRLQDIFVVLTSGVANLFISMVSEMGNTVNIIGHTLYLVPTYRPFDLGQSYFYSLATILPNFGSGIHPTAERQLANWLVWTINPSHASYGFGYGFSFIAEAYLNFGWLGSQLVMLFFGFVLARFSIWSQLSKDPARCAFVATLLSFLLLFARGEFSQYPRYITWYMLIPLGVVWLVLTFTKTNKFEQIKGVH
jgi:oligosaccharide repeat unit polymerase